MKKWISILLLLAMLITAMTACSTSDNPPSGNTLDVDAKTAVKLLLASERLNPAHLKSDGDIFENGSETMRTLAAMTLESINGDNDSISAMTATVQPLFGASASETVYDSEDSGKVTFDGESYYFSEFQEVSNSYKTFSDTAGRIVTIAEDAAQMIDMIKKNVRVVDKWVQMHGGYESYYLHVGENEEILYRRIHDRESVCRRYRNEDGLNVYEYFQTDNNHYDRMVYIPGMHFEMVYGFLADAYSMNYMIADRSKGYWESYWVGPHPTHYNVSYMVMKDDVCYDSFYNPKEGKINFLKIISADKNTDLFYYMGAQDDDLVIIDLQLCGFDGYSGIEVDKEAVQYTEVGGEIGWVYLPNDMTNARLLLKNGKTVKENDTFADGKASVNALRVSFFYPQYTSEISLRIRANTTEEKLAILEEFLAETGLTCRRDLDTVLPGVDRAFDELAEITQYHTWNGYAQATEEGIAAAIRVEEADTEAFRAMLDTVRDAEVIDIADEDAMELNMHFAPVTAAKGASLAHTGMTLKINTLTLSTSDTLLFVENEAYTVGFALSGEDGLVHLKAENAAETVYTKADSFSLTVNDLTLALPDLTEGSFTLVAYIATQDGIRSSATTALSVEDIDTANVVLTHSHMTASKGENGAFVLSYEPITDHHITLTNTTPIGYAEFYQMLASYVCDYGIPSDHTIELLSDEATNTYTPLTGNETVIESGSYRLAYNSKNGKTTVNGYLYVSFTAAE
ncbi:MAG: hypothetical protein IJW46_02315 [Clostridia bacterium]|nr:hypothetical protein [Clostridia bacterium]